jgi:hypothetical protein
MEGLAWLIKWYSRTNGIHSSEMSSEFAMAFLKAYRGSDDQGSFDLDRLSSLIWLSGWINWNFVKKSVEILETEDEAILNRHIAFYKQRGEKLYSLVRTRDTGRDTGTGSLTHF